MHAIIAKNSKYLVRDAPGAWHWTERFEGATVFDDPGWWVKKVKGRLVPVTMPRRMRACKAKKQTVKLKFL